MSQNIALTLTLGGTQKAVSSIKDLEITLSQAREELKGLEIGSQAFTKLSQDVKVAENRLKDLNKQIEGKDLEARIGDFGKLGGAIGASFASATAALQLFGVESEDSLEAVTRAQSALTLALGAKAAAEGAYVVKQYASIVATKLQTVATNTLNASTRAFFTTLLSNPFTAILVGIGALISAMILLNDETETVTQSFIDLSDAQNKAIAGTIGETQRLKELQRIVTSTNTSQRVRVEAYKELQKLVPSLAGLTLTQAVNEGLLNQEIQDQITLIEERARIRAIEQKVTELYTAQFDLVIEAQKELSQLGRQASVLEAQIALQREGQVGTLGRLATQYQNNQKQIGLLTGVTSTYGNSVNTILDIQGKQSELLEKLKKQKESDEALEKERIRLLQVRLNLEVQEVQLANQLLQIELNALTTAQGFTKEETKILPILRQRLETQRSFIEANKARLTQDERIAKFAAENEGVLDRAFDAFKGYQRASDEFIKSIRQGNVDLETFNAGFAQLELTARFAKNALGEFITPEGLENFQNYVNNQKILADSLFDIEKLGGGLSETFGSYVDSVERLNDGNLTYSERAQTLIALERQRRTFVEDFVRISTGLTDDQIKGITETTEVQKEQIRGAQLLAKIYLDNLPKVIQETKQFEDGVNQVNREVNQLNDNLRKGFPEALRAFFKQDFQEFIATLQTGIQQFQQVLGALQQTTQSFFNAEFDTLEKRYARIQEGIVGDSEEAAKKRIEAEKSYQDERIKLEKRAAKTQLQISLAQSLANTAEAITRVFAQTGVGGIIAGSLVAAASGAQSIIIANQLASIDNYQRGGIMKRQGGGFVTGPSHEMGGVKFQGGGVELEGNEAVINRVSTINYMGLLDQINQAGGGRPISSLANESRLIEAIAKQRSTPIRAYVVESDITAKQETARRLERLSQF